MSTVPFFRSQRSGGLGLVGDIGGTNARFALADLGSARPRLISPRTFQCERFATAEDAIDAYLDMLGAGRPRSAVIAVAGPVKDGEIAFTNGSWRLSERALAARGFKSASLINDFAALALGVAGLGADERQTIGPSVDAAAGETIAVIGAGTGFGVGAVVWAGEQPIALTTEGGHASFAPNDEVESELLKILRARFGRVSIERILSGPGLQNLYSGLAEYYGAPAEAPAPEEITRQALSGEDHCSRETLDRFCAVFGSVAGDIALSFGALGGVYLAGGIAPDIIQHLQSSQFRRRFEAKGRFEDYMRQIPTGVVTQPHAALLGAAEHLRRLTAGRTPSPVAT
jgi:glucokinase